MYDPVFYPLMSSAIQGVNAKPDNLATASKKYYFDKHFNPPESERFWWENVI